MKYSKGATLCHGQSAQPTPLTSRDDSIDPRYKIRVSVRFVVSSLIASCFLAFLMGRAARFTLSTNKSSFNDSDKVSTWLSVKPEMITTEKALECALRDAESDSCSWEDKLTSAGDLTIQNVSAIDMQTSRMSNYADMAAYHEALVHPSMFANDNPKRVVIVGNTHDGALREVLKHKTVEEAIVLDQQLVNMTWEHLPECNCSDLVGSAAWCAEDPRVTIRYEDASAWFLNRYADNETSSDAPIDVIIVNEM